MFICLRMYLSEKVRKSPTMAGLFLFFFCLSVNEVNVCKYYWILSRLDCFPHKRTKCIDMYCHVEEANSYRLLLCNFNWKEYIPFFFQDSIRMLGLEMDKNSSIFCFFKITYAGWTEKLTKIHLFKAQTLWLRYRNIGNLN